jgi:hypothetical protein
MWLKKTRSDGCIYWVGGPLKAQTPAEHWKILGDSKTQAAEAYLARGFLTVTKKKRQMVPLAGPP